jgi:hypothetical protein
MVVPVGGMGVGVTPVLPPQASDSEAMTTGRILW